MFIVYNAVLSITINEKMEKGKILSIDTHRTVLHDSPKGICTGKQTYVYLSL